MRNRLSFTLLLLMLFVSMSLPGFASSITGITIETNGNASPYGGIWGTSSMAAIGVSQPGSGSNPFLDSGGSMSLDSGSYLLFLGFEDRFAGANPGDITAVLTVTYSDNSSLSATFTNSSLSSPSIWTQVSGDPSLVLGSSGITNVDRMGDYGAGTYQSNGVSDVVLEFSDTGSIDPPPQVPEPASLFLLGTGLFGVAGAVRRRLFR